MVNLFYAMSSKDFYIANADVSTRKRELDAFLFLLRIDEGGKCEFDNINIHFIEHGVEIYSTTSLSVSPRSA